MQLFYCLRSGWIRQTLAENEEKIDLKNKILRDREHWRGAPVSKTIESVGHSVENRCPSPAHSGQQRFFGGAFLAVGASGRI
jgi:hypothetical protein